MPIVVHLNIFVESQELERVAQTLRNFPEVTDEFEVTGEYDLVALIETDSITSFRKLLKDKILGVKGIRSTVSAVVIHTHKKGGKLVAE
jgi:DNA-binding Lrp family transcriptional regulator